jgi:hypothetical protein
MVLVDEYNTLFKRSSYKSFKYINFKEADGTIPPWDIALARLFMRYDGHLIKNGVKVMASTEHKAKRKQFDPTKINLSERCAFEMKPLEVDDFRNLMYYYTQTGWFNSPISSLEVLNVYMMSQGNFFGAQQYLKGYLVKYY